MSKTRHHLFLQLTIENMVRKPWKCRLSWHSWEEKPNLSIFVSHRRLEDFKCLWLSSRWIPLGWHYRWFSSESEPRSAGFWQFLKSSVTFAGKSSCITLLLRTPVPLRTVGNSRSETQPYDKVLNIRKKVFLLPGTHWAWEYKLFESSCTSTHVASCWTFCHLKVLVLLLCASSWPLLPSSA